MRLQAQAALLDIEGTLGSIAFVTGVLFPYARARMDAFVDANCERPQVRASLDLAAREAGCDVHDLSAIKAALREWSDNDIKVTPLKQIQGMIWETGFTSGELVADLYQDALDALRRFRLEGVRLYVYSSGSVQAQQLLFGHTVLGDLRPLFAGYFDTTIGSKREAASYRAIARTIELPPERIVFFSDAPHELDAASEAGMQTVQVARPEDRVTPAATHRSVDGFTDVELDT